MRRQLFFITLIFISLQLKSQTPEQIGQSIFKAFQSDQKELTEYLEDSVAMKIEMAKTLKEKNDDFKNIYGKDTSIFNPKQIKQLSIGLGKMFDSIYNQGIKEDWQKIIESKHKCGLFSNSYQITKETKTSLTASALNEDSYLLKLGINDAAIRFFVITIETRNYLSKFSAAGISYPNEKGDYACCVFCENGKENMRICSELEEKTKPN